MGGPAGMGDADGTGDILGRGHFLQVAHLALGLVDDEVAPVADERHAGAVIASVFEPGQALDQNGIGLPSSDIADDSTHILVRLIHKKRTKIRKIRQKMLSRLSIVR